jgi:hypothetical protein
LGSGTINNRNLLYVDPKNYKYQAVQNPLAKGISVKRNFIKKDSLQCYYAYTEFKQIESQLPQNSLVIFIGKVYPILELQSISKIKSFMS